MRRWLRWGIGGVLTGVPLLLAVAGPWLVSGPGARSRAFVAGDGHPLGTDFVGRDVWQQVLLGGRTVLLVAMLATVLAYLVAVPWGIAAAVSRHRWVDELLMRPLDLVLALPSLLLLVLLATIAPSGSPTLVAIVALLNLPGITRIVRGPRRWRSAAGRRSRPCGCRARAGGGSPSATSPGASCARSPPTWAPGSPAPSTWWPRPASSAWACRRTPATGR
nr:hypothetical protein GCM10020241_59530 [Streptoalloteichus tenebrarius]